MPSVPRGMGIADEEVNEYEPSCSYPMTRPNWKPPAVFKGEHQEDVKVEELQQTAHSVNLNHYKK